MFDNEVSEEGYLKHYGIVRRSGRYPWGSGQTSSQRSKDFLNIVSELRKEGMSEAAIAKSFNMTTTELRATNTIARSEAKAANIAMAQRLKDKGYSNGAIAERMGLSGESSVRALLAPGASVRGEKLQDTADLLKDHLNKHEYLDVGIGTERYLGMSRTQFDTALSMLKSEGYQVINIQEDSVGTGNKTTIKVLAKEGTKYRDVVTNKDKIGSIATNKDADGKYTPIKEPLSIDLKRVGVRYAEEGGADADGVIFVRPGVKDVSLGGVNYAQVRIAVNGSHYLKGMAIYKDDLPDGIDLQFNTNKSNTGNKLDAMKPLKDDPDLPFGSAIKRQILNKDGTKTTSAMNIVNDEGDWGNWSKSLASQMLSKQKPSLAKEQLDKEFSKRMEDFNEINGLTNPAVKRKLLQSFSDDVDSAAVHLKAAAMPRQATQVILPLSKIKDTEIYAPNFKNGERVALVRYPHGGTFEIPELTVNNKNAEGRKLLGTNPKDAVGINPRVAERLSGADFDGDTVLVIPNNSGKIKSTPALEGLKGFDPKVSYPAYKGMKTMTPKQKQTEMGKVSNLITDMTIKGANASEIARAVRHSMVVIDAEKHKLNYKQSYEDNGIAQLKAKYQGGTNKGASTLISRSTSEVRVNQRKMSYDIDPSTGAKIYRETGESYKTSKVNRRTGETVETVHYRQSKSTQGAEAKDAHSLSSGTPIERIYADHSNRLKGLGNRARKEMISTKSIPYSPSAKKVYATEVSTLNAKLNTALKNAPLERQAQLVANTIIRQKRQANPDMDGDELKKISNKALMDARLKIGAGKTLVDIEPDEWEAIQAGAISNNKLEQILNNADIDKVKALATPREKTVMVPAKVARAKALLNSGKTPSEVAQILGVPVSTLRSSMREGEDG